MPEFSAYDELCAYTLSLGDQDFIHQHVVDTYAAQTAAGEDKPIRIFFALAGLYLYLERGFTGREVQKAHIKLAEHRNGWPHIHLPATRGDLTAEAVMAAEAGDARREALRHWCIDAWEPFKPQQAVIACVLAEADII